MDEMPVDVKKVGITLSALHHVLVPDFIEKCFRMRSLHSDVSVRKGSMQESVPENLGLPQKLSLFVAASPFGQLIEA